MTFSWLESKRRLNGSNLKKMFGAAIHSFHYLHRIELKICQTLLRSGLTVALVVWSAQMRHPSRPKSNPIPNISCRIWSPCAILRFVVSQLYIACSIGRLPTRDRGLLSYILFLVVAVFRNIWTHQKFTCDHIEFVKSSRWRNTVHVCGIQSLFAARFPFQKQESNHRPI